MIAWELFLPEVLPYVHGCPDIMAINAIRNAAIDFCKKSRVWRYDFTEKFALAANQATYDVADLDLPDDGAGTPKVIAQLETVAYLGFTAANTTKAGKVPGPYSEQELDENRPTWREDESEGTANTVDAFTMTRAGLIRIIPIPVVNQADCLSVVGILKPLRDSQGGGDFLYDDWLVEIAHGAKAKLFAMPEKDWSNDNHALYHEREFRRGINRALVKAAKGGGDRSITAYERAFK